MSQLWIRWQLGAFEATRWLIARAVGLLLLLLCANAYASQTLRVRVQRPLEDDALIDEAVVRVIGELGALGFDVEVLRRRTAPSDVERPGQLDPGTEGALVFAREGDSVLVSAWVTGGEQAFVQRFDGRDPSASAEFIAVSGVEALRGVLIDPRTPPEARNKLQNPGASSDPTNRPGPSPDGTPERDPDRADRPGARGEGLHWSLTTLVAPSLGIEARRLLTLGAGGNLVVDFGAVSVGIGFDQLLISQRLRDAAGSAEVQRQNIVGLVRGRLELLDSLDGFAQVQAGAARYSISATAERGYAASDRTHTDFLAGVGVGVAHWPWTHVGWFISVDGFVLPAPIHVHMAGQEVATLGTPAGALSAGLAARYR